MGGGLVKSTNWSGLALAPSLGWSNAFFHHVPGSVVQLSLLFQKTRHRYALEICYLFLKVAVGEIEDFHRSISSGDGQSLGAGVKCHGSDSTGHVLKEPNTVHFKLPHFHCQGKSTG